MLKHTANTLMGAASERHGVNILPARGHGGAALSHARVGFGSEVMFGKKWPTFAMMPLLSISFLSTVATVILYTPSSLVATVDEKANVYSGVHLSYVFPLCIFRVYPSNAVAC